MWILGLNGLNLLMISKKNSVLIFEPKIFLKNTLTDQNLTFPFKKHEIFGGVLSYDNMGDFFLGMLKRSKDVIFHEKKNIHKILLDLLENNLFNF